MTTHKSENIGVIGAGSWGTALAILLAKNGYHVNLWARNAAQIEAMKVNRFNERYLPDCPFPDMLQPQSDLEKVVREANDLLVVVPSHGFRSVCQQVHQVQAGHTRLAFATKGLEAETNKLLHTVIEEELGKDTEIAVLSGPTFAKEVAQGLPTAITVASSSTSFANDLANFLHNNTFRAYTSHDVIGVEVGGAVKNVLAIAAGIADGLSFGANTRAALITRGLAEISRLGVRLGAQSETFMGLAGLGDLVLTCTDDQSRNRRVGLGLAKGKSMSEILRELGQVAEGVNTAREVYELALQLGIEMPIVEHVYRIIYQGEDPHHAVHSLLSRTLKAEH